PVHHSHGGERARHIRGHILESIAVIEKRDQENPKGESKIPEDRLAPQQARRQQRKDESDQPTSGVQRKGHRWQPAVPIPFALVGGQRSERWQQSNSPGPNQSPPEVGVFLPWSRRALKYVTASMAKNW